MAGGRRPLRVRGRCSACVAPRPSVRPRHLQFAAIHLNLACRATGWSHFSFHMRRYVCSAAKWLGQWHANAVSYSPSLIGDARPCNRSRLADGRVCCPSPSRRAVHWACRFRHMQLRRPWMRSGTLPAEPLAEPALTRERAFLGTGIDCGRKMFVYLFFSQNSGRSAAEFGW